MLFAVLLGTFLQADERINELSPPNAESYRLSTGDEVKIYVYDEPDLNVTQQIDEAGNIRLPLIGEVAVAGLLIRQAENRIEETFVGERMLRDPQVSLLVSNYMTRGVPVFGQVKNPGQLAFPPGRDRMDIVEAISRVGGFTGIAKSSAVLVTRAQPGQADRTFTINVEELIAKGTATQAEKRFMIMPGDVIFVPERLF